MAFTTRLASITPGQGTPLSNDTLFLKQNTALSGTTLQTTSLTALVPSVRAGKFRYKLSLGTGTAPTVVAVKVNLTDGTNTATVHEFTPTVAVPLSSVAAVDVVFEFLTGLGVTQIDVLTTLGGTSPGATLDIEVAPTSGNT